MNNLTIIGNGKMASAILSGLYEYYRIVVVGRNKEKLHKLQEKFPKIYTASIDDYDISDQNIILCVKPYALEEVSLKLQGEANNIFSILAGVKIDTLSTYMSSKSYYRIMPNIGAMYSKSITSIYHKNVVCVNEVKNIFEHIGTLVWAESELEIELVTGLCSSAIAFLALVADGLSDGVVREGMSRDKSAIYIKGLFESFAPLLDKDRVNYSDIKNDVMSPAGTTADGCSVLEEYKIKSAFISALNASCTKAKAIE
jgi:pyrroline-5-carboxylate reductase